MADDKNQPPLPGMGGEPPKNVLPMNVEDEMSRSYVDYAMSVIIGREIGRASCRERV